VTVDDFLVRWHALVCRWASLKDRPGSSHALLRDALESGLAENPADAVATAGDPSPEDALECEIAVLRLSGLIDEAGYIENVLPGARRPNPVAHFCRVGWRTMVSPSLDFDVWWYWFTHLGLEDDRLNPLLHYALAGRHAGLPTHAEQPALTTSAPLERGRPVRRACLFAGFDLDGIVDEYVLYYLQELSRHCDVFYLADSFLAPGELAKLRDVTVEAWAIPHGRYDFGSYAMLAQDLVGWERLDEYDEVVFANDSCYALTGFDHVFARMDERACDWWGLQASKFDFSADKGHDAPIPLDRAKAELVGHPEWRQILHLHISSYFLALRRPAFQDPSFRRLIAQIGEQPNKNSIILKYEIGLSRQLIGSGRDFDTFIDQLYPFHPVYNADTFELIAQGFPLLKRTFLVENSTRTPGLAEWKRRVLDLVPDAPVDLIAHNLERVAPQDQLALSFSVVSGPDGRIEAPHLMAPRRMKREDAITPTFEHWWAFPVSMVSHELSADARAIFEQVRDDPSIKKVILTRSRKVTLTGANTSVVPMNSPEGQHHILRAGRVLVSDPPDEAVPYPISGEAHTFVDISGGPTLVRRTAARRRSTGTDQVEELREPRAGLAGSAIGALLSRQAILDGDGYRVLRTGAPRADFITCPDDQLPADLLEQVERLRGELGGRRLVLLTPDAGASGGSAPFTEEEVQRLGTWLEQHGAILGLRESPRDRFRPFAHVLAPIEPVDVSVRRYPHLEPLYRLVDVLVSDYRVNLLDFLLTGRPVISHAPGYDEDRSSGRVLLDLDEVLPRPVCRTFEDLMAALDETVGPPDPLRSARYAWSRSLFTQHDDGHNAWRAALSVRTLADARPGPA